MPYPNRDEIGNVTGYSRWPKFEGQERLADDHPDIVDYRLGGAKREALAEVKGAAQNKVADLDSSATKSAAKTAVLPFKTQFQDASTVAEVEAVKVAAMAAINAL